MKITSLNRRLSRRLSLKTPLRVRIWKSSAPEEKAESLNLSQNGVYFATNTVIREGETVEILLNMPADHGRAVDGMAMHWPRGTSRGRGLDAGHVGGGRAV